MTGELWQALLSVIAFLLLVGGLGLGAIWLRRYPGLRLGQLRRRRLQLVERLELGDRRFVAIVRLDQRELVLGGGLHGVSLLESHDAPLDPMEPAADKPFLAMLSSALLSGRTPKISGRTPNKPGVGAMLVEDALLDDATLVEVES